MVLARYVAWRAPRTGHSFFLRSRAAAPYHQVTRLCSRSNTKIPSGEVSENPDGDLLRDALLDLPEEYWMAEGGSGILSCENDGVLVQLLLLPNLKVHGVYLKFVLRTSKGIETWLSLHNRQALLQTVECEEGWLASAGLFLPPEEAWIAVEQFLRTGEKTSQVEWIRPEDLPTEANW